MEKEDTRPGREKEGPWQSGDHRGVDDVALRR